MNNEQFEIQRFLKIQQKIQNLPQNLLKNKVFPDLYQSLAQLIEKIVQSDEIQYYQEASKKRKIFDILEAKRLKKLKLQQEQGKEYISSDEESVDYDEIGIEKQDYHQIIQDINAIKEEVNEIMNKQEDEENDDESGYGDKTQNECKSESQKMVEQKELLKSYLMKYIYGNEEREFKPLQFLADKLMELQQLKQSEQQQNQTNQQEEEEQIEYIKKNSFNLNLQENQDSVLHEQDEVIDLSKKNTENDETNY